MIQEDYGAYVAASVGMEIARATRMVAAARSFLFAK
jgi:hypothetical protein